MMYLALLFGKKAACVDASWKQCFFSFFFLALCDLAVTFETGTPRSRSQIQRHTFHTVCYTHTVYTPHCAWCYKSQSTVDRPCVKRNSPSLTLASGGAQCDSIWQRCVEGVHVWAGTRPLCPVNGDSRHSCLYRVSMELCCRWRRQCLIWLLSFFFPPRGRNTEPAGLCIHVTKLAGFLQID